MHEYSEVAGGERWRHCKNVKHAKWKIPHHRTMKNISEGGMTCHSVQTMYP